MKLGKGWAPENKEDEISVKASEELKNILMTIFNSKPENRLTIRYSRIANKKN